MYKFSSLSFSILSPNSIYQFYLSIMFTYQLFICRHVWFTLICLGDLTETELLVSLFSYLQIVMLQAYIKIYINALDLGIFFSFLL